MKIPKYIDRLADKLIVTSAKEITENTRCLFNDNNTPINLTNPDGVGRLMYHLKFNGDIVETPSFLYDITLENLFKYNEDKESYTYETKPPYDDIYVYLPVLNNAGFSFCNELKFLISYTTIVHAYGRGFYALRFNNKDKEELFYLNYNCLFDKNLIPLFCIYKQLKKNYNSNNGILQSITPKRYIFKINAETEVNYPKIFEFLMKLAYIFRERKFSLGKTFIHTPNSHSFYNSHYFNFRTIDTYGYNWVNVELCNKNDFGFIDVGGNDLNITCSDIDVYLNTISKRLLNNFDLIECQ